MPTSIALLLASAPILTLSMMLGSDWSPHVLSAAEFVLAASLVILVLWVVVDAVRILTEKWRRFISGRTNGSGRWANGNISDWT